VRVRLHHALDCDLGSDCCCGVGQLEGEAPRTWTVASQYGPAVCLAAAEGRASILVRWDSLVAEAEEVEP
jgi:hypothetical protein